MKMYVRAFPDSWTFVITGRMHLMGWALAFQYEDEVNLNIFVNERYRRKGVAQMLIQAALRKFPQIRLGQHDKATRHLYGKMATLHQSQVIVYDWRRVASKYLRIANKAIQSRNKSRYRRQSGGACS